MKLNVLIGATLLVLAAWALTNGLARAGEGRRRVDTQEAAGRQIPPAGTGPQGAEKGFPRIDRRFPYLRSVRAPISPRAKGAHLWVMDFAVSAALNSAILTLPEASPVNVLIAYDEVSAGRQGMEFFCALQSEAPGGRELHCDLWRFGLIGLPGLHQAAILAAVHARIIVVATSADVDLPTPVKDWLDQSFARKSPGSAAVIALLHSARAGAGLSNSPSRRSLEFMAYRRKLHFFGTPAEGMKQETPPAEPVPEPPSQGPPPLQDIFNRHQRPPRWGINE